MQAFVMVALPFSLSALPFFFTPVFPASHQPFQHHTSLSSITPAFPTSRQSFQHHTSLSSTVNQQQSSNKDVGHRHRTIQLPLFVFAKSVRDIPIAGMAYFWKQSSRRTTHHAMQYTPQRCVQHAFHRQRNSWDWVVFFVPQ